MGEGRQRVSSAHCDPLSYISSICMLVSRSNGCHSLFSPSPHSQIACKGSTMEYVDSKELIMIKYRLKGVNDGICRLKGVKYNQVQTKRG